MTGYRAQADWPSKARDITEATDHAIRSARGHDPDGLTEAIELLEIHPEANEVHAHMVRELLESLHQDGLSGDDVSEVLARTVDGAARSGVAVNPSAVVVVLTGALGVGDQSDEHDAPAPDIPADALVGAAVLVIAHLVTTADIDHEPFLIRAVKEIRRSQTMEMP